MKDVSEKFETLRTAKAQAQIRVGAGTPALMAAGKLPKGDPLPVARVAAVMAAKRTSEIIPYCHPIPIDHVDVQMTSLDHWLIVTAEVKAIAKTGVEMEALTAAGVAALTVYDMLKPVDNELVIESIRLVEKTGGKSDFAEAVASPLRVAVLVLSDSVHSGAKEDKAGKAIVEALQSQPVKVEKYEILPDETAQIREALVRYSDEYKMDMVITTGGTGLSPRDVTVDAARAVIRREIPGVMEAARSYGQRRTPYAMLSRGIAGFRNGTLIVTLPGSSRGAKESMQALFPALLHVFRIARHNPQHDAGTPPAIHSSSRCRSSYPSDHRPRRGPKRTEGGDAGRKKKKPLE
ncbi:MAG: bifunctional molybdenum cofactor biosynthesis protein MoaC/MoaB [Nitrospirae bacterium]|nr:bifunctional molybdenum cofactor biosynthesis protein MoaC/MoaB [Nitrospirota bacterium]